MAKQYSFSPKGKPIATEERVNSYLWDIFNDDSAAYKQILSYYNTYYTPGSKKIHASKRTSVYNIDLWHNDWQLQGGARIAERF